MSTLQDLMDIEPWAWPPDAAETLMNALKSRDTPLEERSIAAQLAGDTVAINDKVADLLLTVLQDEGEPEELRARAAVSFGAVLETCYTDGFEDDDPDMAPPIKEATYNRIRTVLRKTYDRADLPVEVRRRALEAAVRAPEDWHAEAIGKAFASKEESWKLTAVFCMGQMQGFDREIVSMLESPNEALRTEALRSAGAQGVKDAWPHIETLLKDPKTSRELKLEAIAAAGGIGGRQAHDLLSELEDSPDEEIAEAASEALLETQLSETLDGEEDDDESREDIF